VNPPPLKEPTEPTGQKAGRTLQPVHKVTLTSGSTSLQPVAWPPFEMTFQAVIFHSITHTNFSLQDVRRKRLLSGVETMQDMTRWLWKY